MQNDNIKGFYQNQDQLTKALEKKQELTKNKYTDNDQYKNFRDADLSNDLDGSMESYVNSIIDGMVFDETAGTDLAAMLSYLSSAGKLHFISPDVLRRAYEKMIVIGSEIADSEYQEEQAHDRDNRDFLNSYGNLQTLCDSVEGLREEIEQDLGQDLGININDLANLSEEERNNTLDSIKSKDDQPVLSDQKKSIELAILAKQYSDKMQNNLDPKSSSSDLLKLPILTEAVDDSASKMSFARLAEKSRENRKNSEEQQSLNKHTDETKKVSEKNDSKKIASFSMDDSGSKSTWDRIQVNISNLSQINKKIKESSKEENLTSLKIQQNDIRKNIHDEVAVEILLRSGMRQQTVEKIMSAEKKDGKYFKAQKAINEKVDHIFNRQGLYDNQMTDFTLLKSQLNSEIHKTMMNVRGQAMLGDGFIARTDIKHLNDRDKKVLVSQSVELGEESPRELDEKLLEGLSGDSPDMATKMWRSLFGSSEKSKEAKTPWLQMAVEAFICPPLLLLRLDELQKSKVAKYALAAVDGVRVACGVVGTVLSGAAGVIAGIGNAIEAKDNKLQAFADTVKDFTKSSIESTKSVVKGFAKLPEEVRGDLIVKDLEKITLDHKDIRAEELNNKIDKTKVTSENQKIKVEQEIKKPELKKQVLEEKEKSQNNQQKEKGDVTKKETKAKDDSHLRKKDQDEISQNQGEKERSQSFVTKNDQILKQKPQPIESSVKSDEVSSAKFNTPHQLVKDVKNIRKSLSSLSEKSDQSTKQKSMEVEQQIEEKRRRESKKRL